MPRTGFVPIQWEVFCVSRRSAVLVGWGWAVSSRLCPQPTLRDNRRECLSSPEPVAFGSVRYNCPRSTRQLDTQTFGMRILVSFARRLVSLISTSSCNRDRLRSRRRSNLSSDRPNNLLKPSNVVNLLTPANQTYSNPLRSMHRQPINKALA